MAIMSISHFMVDLTCAFLVVNLTETNLVIALILYNFCAFALQMPLGIIIEKKFQPEKTAAVGIALIVLSWVFINYAIIALVIAGVGNALFHLGGGLSVMNKSNKATPLGIFIAPGAAGIYIGAILPAVWKYPILILMIIICIVILTVKVNMVTIKLEPKEQTGKSLLLASMFIVVMLRGFLAVLEGFEWKPEWSIAFVLAVVLGKIAGGFLSDKFGALRVGVYSLLISSVCFMLADNPFWGLLGIFAFQVTMPITLNVVTQNTYKGFGFGLLTFALFIGSVPTFLGVSLSIPLSILSIVSLVIFIIGIKKGAPR